MANVRLTQNSREAFIRAVMHDVPTVNYVPEFQKAQKEAYLKQVPQRIKNLFKDPELAKWIGTTEFYTNGVGIQTVPFPTNEELKDIVDSNVFKDPEVVKITEARKEQEAKRQTLLQHLRSVVAACNTFKQLEAALPEFKQYMPKKEYTPMMYPLSVVNVVDEFKKAGWPKSTNTPQTKAAA